MSRTLKAAILGCGFIGKVHAYAYTVMPFFSDPLPVNVQLTHLVTAHESSASAAARIIPSVTACTDWHQVIQNPEVDIIHICTPNHIHFSQLIEAIKAGKHIYCEKPLCANWNESQQVLQLLDEFQGVSQMTFHHRFFPSVILAHQLIHHGRLGRILEFSGSYIQNSHLSAATQMRWKMKRNNGGGALKDIGSHLLDLSDWLLGDLHILSARSVYPWGEKTAGELRAEDAISILCETRDGAVGTLRASKIAHGHENDLKLAIYGTQGALRINCMEPHYLEFCDAAGSDCDISTPGWQRIPVGHRYTPPDTTFPATKSVIGWLRAHVACLADFLRKVAYDEENPSHPAPNSLDIRRGVYIDALIRDCME